MVCKTFPVANIAFCLSVFLVPQIVTLVSALRWAGAGGLCLTGDNHCLESTNTQLGFQPHLLPSFLLFN